MLKKLYILIALLSYWTELFCMLQMENVRKERASEVANATLRAPTVKPIIISHILHILDPETWK